MSENKNKATAVVVNDDTTQLGILSGLARKAGLEPLSFTGAEAALAAMKPEDPPDIIVTDLYMPGLDGWRFCRLLRSPEYAFCNEVPILVVSATFAGDQPERIAADIGADAFLPAPVDGKTFVAHVKALLSGKEARRLPRALIVEDGKTLAGLLKKAFAAHGYAADTALSVREAEAAFVKTAYDVAVLDYHLPDGAGDSLLDVFRARRPDCVFVMMTTDPTPELALAWMKRGAAAYLRKPFEPEYLIDLCAKARRERALLRTEDLLEARTRELRESEEKYRLIFDNVSEIIFIAQDGMIKLGNHNTETLTGFTLAELMAEPFVSFIHPDDRPLVIERHLQRLSGELPKTDRYEFRIIHKNGETRTVLLGTTIIEWDGKPATINFLNDITERKRAEEALAHERDLLQSVMDGAGRAHLAYLDRDFNFVRVNETYAAACGYRPEEMVGKNHFVLYPHAENEAIFRRVRDTGQPFEIHDKPFEYPDQPERGTTWWDWTLIPVMDADSQVTGLIFSLFETTDRKRAEEALRESEEMHRALVEGLPDIVMRFDREGRHLFVSDNVRETVDMEAAQFIGKTHAEFGFPEAQCRFWDDAIRQVFDSGKPSETEFAFEGKAGPVIFNWRLLPERDARGAVSSVLSISRDITAHRKAEQEYQTLFREMLDGFALHEIILDTAGTPVDYRFLAVNPAFERMTGLKAGDIAGRTVLEVLPGTERHWIETYGKVALTGEPIQFMNHSAVLGKHFEVTAFRPAPGQFACIFQDITSRKRAEEEKEKLQSQLNQAQKMESVGRLAGGVAHDFNNMLSVILGHVEMVLERVDPGQPLFADLLEVRKAAQRSADLARQLLAFARKQTVAPKVLDLNETVEGMLKMLRRLIGEDIDLAWLPGGNLAPVRVDPSQLDQILANLCVNARDAIAGVGKITIETGAAALDKAYCAEHAGFVPGEYVLLAVSDNGCGMDAETLGHLFEPFFTTKELGKGTGLGLATVYGAVKQNNGFINVYSEPGHGTTFRIYLPRHAAKTVRPAEKGSEEPVARGHETVLLVEDEPAILEMVTMMLKREGYTVVGAGTPGEAIRLAREHTGPIHLLMTDVVMPEMNGRDLARNLMSIYPGINRLFMSGYTANVIAHHGVLDEGVHFIQKPFSMEDLAVKIREALGRE